MCEVLNKLLIMALKVFFIFLTDFAIFYCENLSCFNTSHQLSITQPLILPTLTLVGRKIEEKGNLMG